jgi:uncharacterized protein YqjF (DUF2071 family)
MARPFLTARWSNLFLATYAVPHSLLEPRLPPGLELDLHDGRPVVSLVAFDFFDTHVLGVPWPGYRDFAELNLRFYVRQDGQRGVMFVREFVPLQLVAWLARLLYNEPYRAAPLASTVRDGLDHVTIDHRLRFGGRTHAITATGKKPAFRPAEDSLEHFFKEHHWGYGVNRSGRAIRYEVEHPVWNVYPVQSYEIDLDWGLVYGPEWAFLGREAPLSTVLAVGSPVAVYPKGRPVMQPAPCPA